MIEKNVLNIMTERKIHNAFNGGGNTIGCLPYAEYRKITHTWAKVPRTEDDYYRYKYYCYIRHYDPECMQSIIENANK